MGNIRKQISSGVKGKVALEAVKGHKTSAEISKEFQIHPNRVSEWKKILTERVSELFDNANRDKEEKDHIDRLYRQVGELQCKLDWLKKKSGFAD